MGWVSPGEKEKNKTLPTFMGASDAPGRGSSTVAELPVPGDDRTGAAQPTSPGHGGRGESFCDQSFWGRLCEVPRGVAAHPSPTPRRFSPFPEDVGGGTVGLCSGGGAGPPCHGPQGAAEAGATRGCAEPPRSPHHALSPHTLPLTYRERPPPSSGLGSGG